MYGLYDEIQGLNDEIKALKAERDSLITCVQLLLENDPYAPTLAKLLLEIVESKKG